MLCKHKTRRKCRVMTCVGSPSLPLSSFKTNKQNGNAHGTARENARARLAPFLGLWGFVSCSFLSVIWGLSLCAFCPTPPLRQAYLIYVCCSGMELRPPRQFSLMFLAHNPQQNATEDSSVAASRPVVQ